MSEKELRKINKIIAAIKISLRNSKDEEANKRNNKRLAELEAQKARIIQNRHPD